MQGDQSKFWSGSGWNDINNEQVMNAVITYGYDNVEDITHFLGTNNEYEIRQSLIQDCSGYDDSRSTNSVNRRIWTVEENKKFEMRISSVITEFAKPSEIPWEYVAQEFPNRSIEELQTHYRRLCLDIMSIQFRMAEPPKYWNSQDNLNTTLKSSNNSSNTSGKRPLSNFKKQTSCPTLPIKSKPNRIISKPEPKPRISVLKETKKNRECENPFFKDFAGGDRISLPTNTKNPNALREKILQARFSKRMASQNDIKISTEKMVKPDLRRNQSLNAVPRPQEKENGFFVFKH